MPGMQERSGKGVTGDVLLNPARGGEQGVGIRGRRGRRGQQSQDLQYEVSCKGGA